MPSIAWSPHRPERVRANGGTPAGRSGRGMARALSRGSGRGHRARGERQGRRHHRTPGGHHAVIRGARLPGASPEGGQIASRLRRMHDVARAGRSQSWAPREGGTALSTVLVVDDEERIRTLITRTLTAEGHSVDTAGDGDHALRPAGRAGGRPGAAGPGHAALPRSARCCRPCAGGRTRPRSSCCPASPTSRPGCRRWTRGAVDVVAKPFPLAELLARTRRHLAAARAPARRPPVPRGRRHPARPRPSSRHRWATAG